MKSGLAVRMIWKPVNATLARKSSHTREPWDFSARWNEPVSMNSQAPCEPLGHEAVAVSFTPRSSKSREYRRYTVDTADSVPSPGVAAAAAAAAIVCATAAAADASFLARRRRLRCCARCCTLARRMLSWPRARLRRDSAQSGAAWVS